MAHDVFISYSAEDKAVAEAVCAVLESKHIRCWIAPRDIWTGAVWAEAVVDAIDDSRIFVLVFSSSSNSSRQVVREVERAMSQGVTILPLRIDDAPLSKAMQFYIDRYHWLDARAPPLKKHLQQLARTIQGILAEEHPVSETIQAPEEKERPAILLEPQPILGVDCERLDFADIKPGSRASRSFSLSNAGTGRLAGTITTTQPWLKVLPDRVDLKKGEKKLSVTVDTSGLVPGFEGSGDINIDTNGGQAKVAVGLSIVTVARPKPIGKPVIRMPARRSLIAIVGTVLLVIAGVSGIYFIFGHLFTPSLPPAIHDVSVSDITETSAIITWATDKLATSQAEYGYTANCGMATALDERLVTSHRVELTGLQPNTTCYFRVMSKDASGRGATSDIEEFTPLLPDTAPPVISKVKVAGYTGGTATITCETEEDAICQVEYGATDAYGNLAPSDGELTTGHSVELTGLRPNTTYHFKVKTKDRSGNEAVSGDQAFTTWVAEKDWAEYVNEEYSFSIQYPSDYVPTEDVEAPVVFQAAPAAQAHSPVVIVSIREVATLADALTAGLTTSDTGFLPKRWFSNIKIGPEKEATLSDGTKATVVKVNSQYSAPAAPTHIIETLACAVKKGDKWITVTVNTMPAWYLYNEALFSQIAHTLRFTAEE